MVFANPLFLLGLAAVALPPLARYLRQRRCQEVDWGAMLFLRLTPTAQRTRARAEAIRLGGWMAILGLLAVALAGPSIRSSLLPPDDPRPRNTVILIDCSVSMGFRHEGITPTESAIAWARGFLATARPGDRFAVLAVSNEVIPVVGALVADPEAVRSSLELLPDTRGTADWPAAVEAAARLLDHASGPPEILALTDGQRFGWANPEALAHWERLTQSRATGGTPVPPLWAVNVVPDRPTTAGGPVLLPITVDHPVTTADAAVTLHTGLRGVRSTDPPLRVRLEIDGRAAGDIPLPPSLGAGTETHLRVTRRFPPGPHLIALRLDPETRASVGRQEYAIDVEPVIPVLIVDGETQPDIGPFGSEPLRTTLAPDRGPAAGFVVRMMGVTDFTPAALTQDVTTPGTSPWVVILSDVKALTPEQAAAVEDFVANGGGVVVIAGERTNPVAWNRTAFRDGSGWLPARLVKVQRAGPASPAPTIPAAFDFPVGQAIRENRASATSTISLPIYWKLDLTAAVPPSVVRGVLSNRDPLLVEKPTGRGLVVLSAIPFDDGWGANLTRASEGARLIRELGYHLASTRWPAANLEAGAPIVFRPRNHEPPRPITLLGPDGTSRAVPVGAWPAVIDTTAGPGAYRVTTAGGQARWFTVREDIRESDLTLTDEADREALSQTIGPVGYVTTVDDLRKQQGRIPVPWEIGGWFFSAILAILVAEIWYTRRRYGGF